MAQLGAHKDYVAVQVTLTSANTNYNLMDLVKAIELNAPLAGSTVLVQADPGNTAGTRVLFGDAALSATRLGYSLGVGDSRNYSTPQQAILFGQVYAQCSTAGQKVNVEIMAS